MNKISKTWSGSKQILCIRLDSMGDVLMTSPALRAVKESAKGRKITLLTSQKGLGIAKFIPEIDDTLVFNAPWVQEGAKALNPKLFFETVQKIKQKKFDAAISFTNFSQNAIPSMMMAYLAGIPLRLGYSRENPYELLTDWVPDREPLGTIRHGVIRQLELVAEVGMKTKDQRLGLSVSKSSFEKVLEILKGKGVNVKKPLILMHPGGSEERRRYPTDLFAEAAGKMIRKIDCQLLITGTRPEESAAKRIVDFCGRRAISLAGKLSLGELIALIKLSKLLVSNNTGPVHIASAVGTPIVVLYAKTNPEHTPWKVKNKILYFDVPKNLQSKNILLNFEKSRKELLLPDPQEIVQAVEELM